MKYKESINFFVIGTFDCMSNSLQLQPFSCCFILLLLIMVLDSKWEMGNNVFPFFLEYAMSKQHKNEHFPDEQVTLQAISYALFTITRGHSTSVMAAHKTVTSRAQAQ